MLKLGGNRLEGEGLIALCKGLRGNSKLQELSLSDNRIEFVSATCIMYTDCCMIAVIGFCFS